MFNPNAGYDKRLLTLVHGVYLHNFRRVDWDSLLESLKDKEGSTVSTDPARWNSENTQYSVIEKMWKDNNVNPDSIKWTNYYPGKDFDSKIVDEVAKYLRLEGVHRSWISRVDPGYYAARHWDIDDHEQEYLAKGPIKRYSVFLNKPTIGHVFILEDEYLYNMAQGSIVKWNNHNMWHTGINGGLSPKYMLHILGY